MISPEEELARIVPVIRALAADDSFSSPSGFDECSSEVRAESKAVISVDTFYSQVAKEAVAAGAHIVNANDPFPGTK